MKLSTFIRDAAVFLAIGLAAGFGIGYFAMPEKVVTETVEVQTVREITPVDSPDLLREFASPLELRQFIDRWEYVPSTPRLTETGTDDANDCDDWSVQFVQEAARHGYITGIMIGQERKHTSVCVPIGNQFYFVEPQTGVMSSTFDGITWLRDQE